MGKGRSRIPFEGKAPYFTPPWMLYHAAVAINDSRKQPAALNIGTIVTMEERLFMERSELRTRDERLMIEEEIRSEVELITEVDEEARFNPDDFRMTSSGILTPVNVGIAYTIELGIIRPREIKADVKSRIGKTGSKQYKTWFDVGTAYHELKKAIEANVDALGTNNRKDYMLIVNREWPSGMIDITHTAIEPPHHREEEDDENIVPLTPNDIRSMIKNFYVYQLKHDRDVNDFFDDRKARISFTRCARSFLQFADQYRVRQQAADIITVIENSWRHDQALWNPVIDNYVDQMTAVQHEAFDEARHTRDITAKLVEDAYRPRNPSSGTTPKDL